MAAGAYPVHVDALPDPPSRWLWIFKWRPAIPRDIVLAFGWIASSCRASARVNISASVPSLPRIATCSPIGGVIFLAAGVVLIAVPVRRASR